MINLKTLINEKKKPIEKITREAFLYLDPKEPKDTFAQCGTCKMFTGTGCTILGKTKITPEMSCNLYVRGTPVKDQAGKEEALITPKDAGLVNRKVRCENCRSFDAKKSVCMLYQALNKSNRDIFNLEEKVDPKGCCNAQMPK